MQTHFNLNSRIDSILYSFFNIYVLFRSPGKLSQKTQYDFCHISYTHLQSLFIINKLNNAFTASPFDHKFLQVNFHKVTYSYDNNHGNILSVPLQYTDFSLNAMSISVHCTITKSAARGLAYCSSCLKTSTYVSAVSYCYSAAFMCKYVKIASLIL